MSERTWHKRNSPSTQQTVYGLGFIGALVYFIQHAVSVWAGILGILKAIVWPAILVYHLLKLTA